MEKNLLKLFKKKLPFQKKDQTVSQETPSFKASHSLLSKKPPVLSDREWEIFNEKPEIPSAENNEEKKEFFHTEKIVKSDHNKNTGVKKIPTNKNKIPVLDTDNDLEKIFNDPVYQKKGKTKIKSAPARPEVKKHNNLRKNLKNKNGINIITNSSDLNDFFLSSEEKSTISKMNQPAENERAYLNAKKEGASVSRPISLDKRLSRFPAPERTLDLHGFSSIQAKLKVENFIASSFKKGFFTLKIITGKGSHSEFGAVLPQITEDIVKEMVVEKKVLHYKWENEVMDASGSMTVYLNRFND